MNYNNLKAWLDTLELTPEQQLMAGLAISLAKSFDDNGNASTAAELRKTVLELKRMVAADVVEHDPLAEMLTRNHA